MYECISEKFDSLTTDILVQIFLSVEKTRIMATPETEEAEYLSTCSICFHNFDFDLCRPKILPCSHTFCFRCLQTMHFGTTLTCPLCCATIQLDEVTSLPNNIYAQQIIRLNQQMHDACIPKELSMHWCFVCESVAKPGCQQKTHSVLDMGIEAKGLQAKLKRSKTNLVTAIAKRRQFKQSLELDDTIVSLPHFKAYSEEIKKQMGNNSQELQRLSILLEMSDFDFSGDRQKIEVRFQETEIALDTAMKLTEKWHDQIESIRYVPTAELGHTSSLPNPHSKVQNVSLNDVDLLAQEKISSSDSVHHLKESGMNGPYFPLNCRSIRIGNHEFKPSSYVLFSSGGITLDAPVANPQGQSSATWMNVTIASKQLLRVAAYFNRSRPAIFLDVLPDLCSKVSSQLDLIPKNGPCWDCNSKDDSQKRLVLLPFSLDNSAKNALAAAYSDTNLFYEINKVEANLLLIPPPSTRDDVALLPKTKTTFASSLNSSSSTGKIEKRITRSVTKRANLNTKEAQALEKICSVQNKQKKNRSSAADLS